MTFARLFAYLRPAPTVPRLPWSARESTWLPRPDTMASLLVGLWLFGVGEGALLAAGLGNTPWTVLAQGVADHSSLDVGGATIAVSAVVLLGWIPLRQRPGLGTIANLIVIGVALDVMAHVLPHPHELGWRLLEAGGGIATVGLGSAFYLTANLGPGPRDGWMTGIHRRSGVSIAVVRTAIEVVVLAIGFVLGGDVGIATFAFAVLVGYALAAFFRLLVWLTAGQRFANGTKSRSPEPT